MSVSEILQLIEGAGCVAFGLMFGYWLFVKD
jgi:hypothetical protein